GIRVEHTVSVLRSPEELYRFWRNFENLPRFMHYLESVQVTGDKRSHWVAKGPLDFRVEWDAEVTLDRPNEQINWRSLSVPFAPLVCKMAKATTPRPWRPVLLPTGSSCDWHTSSVSGASRRSPGWPGVIRPKV